MLTLCCIVDLEAGRLAFAGWGLAATCGLDAVDGVDAAARSCLRIVEIEPRDRLRKLKTRARRRGSVGLTHLADHGDGVRSLRQLVEREDWRAGAEEVVADQVRDAVHLQCVLERLG